MPPATAATATEAKPRHHQPVAADFILKRRSEKQPHASASTKSVASVIGSWINAASSEVVHPLVMAVPVALEQLFLVVLLLQQKEVPELREAGVDLPAQRVAVI